MLFLDSALLDDAERAGRAGWVTGITTNPSLMAATGREWHDQLPLLLAAFESGPVFVQPPDAADAETAVRRALSLAPSRVVAKLPAQARLFDLGARLAGEGISVAFTAVYTAAQAVVAACAGAEWVIPYVDRAERLRPGGDVVTEMRAALDALGAPTRLLAASIKSPDQAVQAFRDGAHAVSAPLDVLIAMTHDPLTDEAAAEFRRAAR